MVEHRDGHRSGVALSLHTVIDALVERFAPYASVTVTGIHLLCRTSRALALSAI
jgi:hypothetical protein